MRKSFILFGVLGLSLSVSALTGCGNNDKKDKYDGDKLVVNINNLYFGSYQGGDTYLETIGNQFGLSFKLGSYDWDNWSVQVNSAINGGKVPDVFHADVDCYNFAQTYKFWAEENIIKPLPEDLSKWPNLKKMIDNTSNIDSLKLDGKLYGIPIAKNTEDYSTSFSPFTYIYRRDWAKKWGVYQENDEYTWDQFTALLDKFKEELAKKQSCYAFADVEWGYPSVINFYKQVPHCFAQNEDGEYVNNYTTPEYLAGLEVAKTFMNEGNGYYHPNQTAVAPGTMNENYGNNRVGVFYENLSYTNLAAIRELLRSANESVKDFNIDDATAIMKIRGEDGKYALEGTDNWFSMTFFDEKISDEKQTKLLNLIDWLLSEEGTRFAIYGVEDFDYVMVNGKPQIIEENWPIGENGNREGPLNGAKYLRYMASLGYDTLSYDPVVNQDVNKYLNDWEKEMKDAYDKGELRILKETAEVRWLTTPNKSDYSGTMRETALVNVKKYTRNVDLHDQTAYINSFGKIWKTVLDEINKALKK